MRKAGLSYQSVSTLNKLVGALPSGPKWEVVPVTVEGFNPLEPILLYKRNAQECVEYLFNSPLFIDHMNLVPVKHFTADGKQVFREPVSGMQAWKTQV